MSSLRLFDSRPLPFVHALALVSLACAAASPLHGDASACQRNSDCESDHCEPSARDNHRICCAIECASGTMCASDGGRCVACDPAQQDCKNLLQAGALCTKNSQCESSNCLPDENSIRHCCDESCTDGCDDEGQCLRAESLPPGREPAHNSPISVTPTAVTPGSSSAIDNTPPELDKDPELGYGSEDPDEPKPAGTTTAAPQDDNPSPAPSSTQGQVTPNPSTTAEPTPSGNTPDPESAECSGQATRPCSELGALGNCAAGVQRCSQGQWGDCSVLPADADSCDVQGDDADCNGLPNEGCSCLDGEQVVCGPATDTGRCEFGASICVAGALSECRGAVLPRARNCNSSEDTDCNGQPDNTQDATCACSPGAMQVCNPHPGLDGQGRCQAGTQTCQASADGSSSSWGACSGDVGPANADACDVAGDDSNCNGVANEGCQDSGDALWSFAGTAQGWQLRSTDPERLEANAAVRHALDDGDPPGALRITMPFDAGNQKIELNVQLDEPLDVTGRVFTARVKLANGLSTDQEHPGGIKLFAKAGSEFVYVSGPWTYLPSVGSWSDVVLDPADPDLSTGAFELGDVRELGFELRTFTNTDNVSSAVVYVDTIEY